MCFARRSRLRYWRFGVDRQTDYELAPSRRPLAAGLDAPAMQFNQALDQRQADAESALRPYQGRLCLRENVENTGEYLGDDADTAILDGDGHVATNPHSRQLDATALLGIFGGVVEKVGEHLGQPHRVSIEVDRLRRQGEAKRVAAGINERTAPFQGGRPTG